MKKFALVVLAVLVIALIAFEFSSATGVTTSFPQSYGRSATSKVSGVTLDSGNVDIFDYSVELNVSSLSFAIETADSALITRVIITRYFDTYAGAAVAGDTILASKTITGGGAVGADVPLTPQAGKLRFTVTQGNHAGVVMGTYNAVINKRYAY